MALFEGSVYGGDHQVDIDLSTTQNNVGVWIYENPTTYTMFHIYLQANDDALGDFIALTEHNDGDLTKTKFAESINTINTFIAQANKLVEPLASS